MSEIVLTAYNGLILGPVAKVLGLVMNFLYNIMSSVFGIENIGLTIIVFTLVIYICMFPLTYKQQKFAKLSALIQPEIKAVQAKYNGKKDQASQMAMSQEINVIYDKYGISPAGGCGYMLISFPILIALYRVIYAIPAYVSGVKGVFLDLANSLIASDGFATKMTEFTAQVGLASTIKADYATEESTVLLNHVVDVLYRMSSSSWATLSETFPDLASVIETTEANASKMNYFLGLNIADSPLSIIQANWSNGSIYLTIAAAAIPILSYLTQILNLKMMPSQNTGNDNDQMAKQLKTMNTVMPLMSLFFCFSFPVGVGLYWIFGALFRTVQQFALNQHFKNADMDKMIEENRAKMKKKREKMGIPENKINNAARTNTRNMESKASVSVADSASKEEILQKKAIARDNAKAGSLSAKANLVKEFNEKNNRKN